MGPSLPATPLGDLRPSLTVTVPTVSQPQPSNIPPETPRRTPGSRRLPDWFPLSGTISMISRTTHETYSADPSPLFTSQLQSVATPLTSAAVTPSSVQKAGQLLEVPGSTSRSHAPATFPLPSAITTTDHPLEKDAASPREPPTTDASEEQFWIKITALGQQPQLSSAVGTGVLQTPLISVQPPTNISDLNQGNSFPGRGILTNSFVDSPEGSISGEFAHVLDEAVPANLNLDRSIVAQDNDIASSEVDVIGSLASNRVVRSQGSDAQHGDTMQILPIREGETPDDVPRPTIINYPTNNASSIIVGLRGFTSQGEPQVGSHSQPLRTTPEVAYDTLDHLAQIGDYRGGEVVSPVPLQDSISLDGTRSERSSAGRSTPLDELPLLQRLQNVIAHGSPSFARPARYDIAPRVDLMAATFLYQGLNSFVGPNARWDSNWLASTENTSYYPPGYPRYSVESLDDLKTFGHPELIPTPLPFLSIDEEIWYYSHGEYIPPQYFSVHHYIREGLRAGDEQRRWLTLGLLDTNATHGAAMYLVYNRQNRYQAVLRVVHPKYLSESQIKKLFNELVILRHLRSRPKTPYIMACMTDSLPFWRSRWDYIYIETVSIDLLMAPPCSDVFPSSHIQLAVVLPSICVPLMRFS